MKTRLLREVRRLIDYKFDGTHGCIMYVKSQTTIITNETVEGMLKKLYVITYQDSNLTWLDWNWHSIYSRYYEKCKKREFKKMTGVRKAD